MRFYQEFAGQDEVDINYLEAFQHMAEIYYARRP
jgi:hypothetical protein